MTTRSSSTIAQPTSIIHHHIILNILGSGRCTIVQLVDDAITTLLQITQEWIIPIIIIRCKYGHLGKLHRYKCLLSLQISITCRNSIYRISISIRLIKFQLGRTAPVEVVIPVVVHTAIGSRSPGSKLRHHIDTKEGGTRTARHLRTCCAIFLHEAERQVIPIAFVQILGIIFTKLQIECTLSRLLIEMHQTACRNREDCYLSQHFSIVLPHRVVGAIHQYIDAIFCIKLERNRTRRTTQRLSAADRHLQILCMLEHISELRQSDAHISLVGRIFTIPKTEVDTRSILQHSKFIFDRIRTDLIIHLVNGDDISVLDDRQQTECMYAKLKSLLQLRGCSQNQFTIVDIRLDF